MKMSSSTTFMFIFTLTLSFLLSCNTSHYVPCSESFYLLAKNNNISNCKKLTTLGAEFGWEIVKEHNMNETQIAILIGTRLNDAEMMWLAWGVNPRDRPQMVGTRAIIGIRQPNGSLTTDSYNITSDTKLGCRLQPSAIDVGVKSMTLDYVTEIDYLTLHTALVLPNSMYNISRLNHVWQVGYNAEGSEPKMHPTTLHNVDSTETIDLANGFAKHVGEFENRLRTIHGILNIIGWGTFLPAGVIVARYFKYPLNLSKHWFYTHIGCQIIAYILGTAGWSVGLWLGHASRYYSFRLHRLFAIFIFTFTTLQVLALWLRPKQGDEFRKYWNMYHHFLGYALLAVIAINIFHGIDILESGPYWKWAYISILGMFAIIVIALEIYTWSRYVRERKGKKPTPQETTRTTVPAPQASTNP